MEPIARREFIKTVAGGAALTAFEGRAATPPADSGLTFLATWAHGKPAVDRAAEVYTSGGSLLDAIEKGINVTEADPNVTSVGYGGLPNAEGVVELDAAMMDGTRHRAGSVCSLRMIMHPVSVARLVLERTSHTTLAGEGAFEFALKMGFKPETLLTPQSLQKWQEWKADPHRKTYWLSPENHDTIGMVAIDGKGHVAAGSSTSGTAFKIPGRVGDTPLVGCGLYADDNVGAASATGDGDLMTNYCTSISIVQLMARGAPPQDACMELLQHIAKTIPENKDAAVAVIAINKHGEIGAGSMNDGFFLKYAVWRNNESQVLDSVKLY